MPGIIPDAAHFAGVTCFSSYLVTWTSSGIKKSFKALRIG